MSVFGFFCFLVLVVVVVVRMLLLVQGNKGFNFMVTKKKREKALHFFGRAFGDSVSKCCEQEKQRSQNELIQKQSE